MARLGDLSCADCGKAMWSGKGTLPQGQARCLGCRRARHPDPKPKRIPGTGKSWRDCEVCGQRYRAKQTVQRTCGRVCGQVIRLGAPASAVAWRQCKHCPRWYTAKGRKRCTCTGYKPTSGVRSIQCRDCAKPFGYVIVSNHPARCPDCREIERKRVQKNARKARRALQRGAQVEPVNVAKVYERDRWRCGLCRKRVNKSLKYPHPMSASLDHVLPLSLDGAHSMANVQLAHLTCNHAKSNGGSQQLALVG